MKVAVRGFVGFDRIFEDIIDVDPNISDADMMELVIKHANRMAHYDRFLIEIEFVEDAPNPNRFFRFGTDTTRMVDPHLISHGKKPS